MGEIHIPVSGPDTVWMSDYTGQRLRMVVEDWMMRVQSGELKCWYGTDTPIPAEHLRIAKAFVTSSERG